MSWLDFREPVSTWTHGLWMVLSIPATWMLWRRSRGDGLKRFGLLVFGLSLFLCYAGSTLYHAVRLPERQIHWFATLDYIGIFLLIAGTITPVALVVLRGPWRWSLLTLSWLLAALGIGLRLAEVPMSRFASTGLYLGMGWLGCFAFLDVARALRLRQVWSLFLGGLLYSTGAVLNHLGWPRLWAGTFSTHELFHLFVMGGSLCHFWFMLTVVVPFQRRPAATRGEQGDADPPARIGTGPRSTAPLPDARPLTTADHTEVDL